MKSIRQLMESEFRHFNARETRDAARAWEELVSKGGKMFLTMAGAMSTGEIGLSLADLIRKGMVHGISCSAANLEEDVFNLLAANDYKMLPDYRDLSPEDEAALYEEGYNRVTDTAIPEAVMLQLLDLLLPQWQQAEAEGESKFPSEFLFELFEKPDLRKKFQINPRDSWLLAAKEMRIPVYSPGFEDSTMGNMFTAQVMKGKLKSHAAIKTGTQQMEHLACWYLEQAENKSPAGFFQIGGGIAADFAICVVPMLIQDLGKDIPFWAYFAQIGDSTTSYGSYSGAVPSEKITWGKLSKESPAFMINSDASIVAPLIFHYLLEGLDDT